jgi:acetyl-CoA carboxylase/biotin carboxylase 1
MHANGISHLVVKDDYGGILEILKWLSFIPRSIHSELPVLEITDPIERPLEFTPGPNSYDPRDMIRAFYDENSFVETLDGWAKTVVIGRARLGGIPVGVITSETRAIETLIPADPASVNSQEQIQMKAGQVWCPDSSFKTAQAINDFNNGEQLPLIIFANWRGFSGGMSDMYNEILKFGSMIVEALNNYRQPVFVYIPPYCELRGGAWVVLDSNINPEVMEMYCDPLGRGNVLEANAVVEIKYRQQEIQKLMSRLDPEYQSLLEKSLSDLEIESQLKEREERLKPVFEQIATTFAELHDTPGRMKAKEVIKEIVEWKTSRKFFYWKLKRRLNEKWTQKMFTEKLGEKISKEESNHYLQEVFSCDRQVGYENDQFFCEWFDIKRDLVMKKINFTAREAKKRKLKELLRTDISLLQDVFRE